MVTEYETELDPQAPHRPVRRDEDDVRMDVLVLLGVEPVVGPHDVFEAPLHHQRVVKQWEPRRTAADVTVETRSATAGAPVRHGYRSIPADISGTLPPTVRSIPRRRPAARVEAAAAQVAAPLPVEAPPMRAAPPIGIAVPNLLLPWLIASMVAMAAGVGLLMILAAVLLAVAVLG